MFLKYLDTSGMRLLYCDTDSIFYSLGVDNLDDLVRADKKDEWFNEIKPQWFAMPKTDRRENAIQQRKPGSYLFESNVEKYIKVF